MCPPLNILLTKSDYFRNGRTESVLRPPTYKALRAKISGTRSKLFGSRSETPGTRSKLPGGRLKTSGIDQSCQEVV